MHTGRNIKSPAVSEEELKAFLETGGSITKLESKREKKHSLRTKAHQKGGAYSRYMKGGRTSNQKGKRYSGANSGRVSPNVW